MSQTDQTYNAQKNYMQQNEKVHSHKRKSLSLFQPDYVQLQSKVSSLTSWGYIVQAVPSKKKKKTSGRKKENEMKISGKEEKKKKGMERVCAEGKGKGRMRCGKKEGRKRE